MPNRPVIERIARHIVQCLEEVQTVNGSACDFTVERRKKNGNGPKQGKTVVILDQFPTLPAPGEDMSVQLSSWETLFGLQIYIDQGTDLETPLDELINDAVADACTALNGTNDRKQRDNLAMDTTIIDITPFEVSPHHGVYVNFMVRFDTAYNDPRTPAYTP